MDAQVILVDVNPKMVAAWREVFVDHPEVLIVTIDRPPVNALSLDLLRQCQFVGFQRSDRHER